MNCTRSILWCTKYNILFGSDLAERYFFEEWQKITYNTDTYNINYYKEYVGSVEIYQLNEQDERTYGCKLEEVFSRTIGD